MRLMFSRSESSLPTRSRLARRLALGLATAGLATSCGAGNSGSGTSLAPGTQAAKPGGGTFFVDATGGGHGTGLHLVEVNWGRLVNVHALDAEGRVEPTPAFRDFVINESIQSDADAFRLETNAITQETRLVILRQRTAQDSDREGFDALLRRAASGLAAVLPESDDGSATLLSFVARNATLVLRFDDALDDSPAALRDLPETVHVLVGEPPTVPFGARWVFDPNHGSLVDGVFRSTRVLVDLTVSAGESAGLPVPQPINAVGLPAGLAGSSAASVALRLPTRTDPGSGQFEILRSLSGAGLSAEENGPVDGGSPTRDVVRALRAGHAGDANNGFLLDLNAPALVGEWNARVEAARDDPEGRPGFDYLVDLRFTSVCRAAPAPGDVLASGGRFLEVLARGAAPDGDGRVPGLRIHGLSADPLPSAAVLNGLASLFSIHTSGSSLTPGCWLRFAPQPDELPATGVASTAEVRVRFSEPMDPASLSPFDDFSIVRGDASTAAGSRSLIVGEVSDTGDRREFVLRPTLPLPHDNATAEVYHVRLGAPRDLAGNALASRLPPIEFALRPQDAPSRSLGTVLRFTGVDELEPLGLPDLRGQFLLDLERGRILPRPVTLSSYPVDRTNPVPSIMTPLGQPIATPISPMGSKMQTLWRYCDLGWQVLDESKYDLDVVGLAWAPFQGQVFDDFFERFEIVLSHSRMLPDEALSAGLPVHENSGLNSRQPDFASNVLVDPLSPPKTVHARELGYRIRGADLFLASSGTPMLPFPLNRGEKERVTYTWRDTAVRARGGPSGVGIPLDVEAGPPLFLENRPGYVAPSGEVPSFGLPLLMEFRCFPSDTAIGLNGCDVFLAVNSSALPSFRSYSTGGTNTSGIVVKRNPDLEEIPHGGFNPRSSPPGRPTPRGSDNTLYPGQLDVVTRISRVHTVWIDSQLSEPDYRSTVVEPRASEQPAGTRVVLEYRGAHGFDLSDLDAELGQPVDESAYPFDARQLDPYGDVVAFLPTGVPGEPATHARLGTALFRGGVAFKDGLPTWSADVDALDGARFLQLRLTFVNDIESGASPALSSIGLAYSGD